MQKYNGPSSNKQFWKEKAYRGYFKLTILCLFYMTDKMSSFFCMQTMTTMKQLLKSIMTV